MLNTFGLGGGGGGKPVYVAGKPVYVAGIKVESAITPKDIKVEANLEVKEIFVSVQVC